MSKKTDRPLAEERISGDDLNRVQFAMDQKRAADAAWEQEIAYLTQRYRLAEADRLDIASGTISRTAANPL